ncbi:MAG: hypothetical protein ACM34K_18515 [Bacillota bacterium]
MKKFYSLFILLMLSLVVTSCSKKDDNPAAPSEEAPGIPAVSFKGPNTNSTDQWALYTKSTVESMNAYPMMLQAFSSAKPANSNGQWKWELSPVSGFSEAFVGSKNSQGGYTWQLILNGTYEGITYNNWKALEGNTSADGKSGTWKAYDDNTTVVVAEYNWSTSSAGVLSGTFQEYENGAVNGKLEITNNPDNSGSLLAYDSGILVFKSIWVAAGTGQWWAYENGVVKTQGSWQ